MYIPIVYAFCFRSKISIDPFLKPGQIASMSKIQEAFDAGNYALVRKLAKDSKNPQDLALLEKIKTDPKVIWAGLFGLVFALVVAVYALELIR